MNLLKRLKTLLGNIESAVTDNKGLVDYKNAHKQKLFSTFEEAVCELQGVDMGNMDDRMRLAFGINLYNLMIKYGFMKVGIGSTALARGAFFSGVKFNVGGDILSFNDLENGVLRGNAVPPYSLICSLFKDGPSPSSRTRQGRLPYSFRAQLWSKVLSSRQELYSFCRRRRTSDCGSGLYRTRRQCETCYPKRMKSISTRF